MEPPSGALSVSYALGCVPVSVFALISHSWCDILFWFKDKNKKLRPLYDIPYMFEAREFLRKKLIGKKVSDDRKLFVNSCVLF